MKIVVYHKQQAKSVPNSTTELKTVSATQQADDEFSEEVHVFEQDHFSFTGNGSHQD